MTTIIKGAGEILVLLAILGFFASLEYRLRGKVGKDFCSDRGKALDQLSLWLRGVVGEGPRRPHRPGPRRT